MLKETLKSLFPEQFIIGIKKIRHKYEKIRKKVTPALTERTFNDILIKNLELKQGDVVFIHSSIDQLSLDFPFYRILYLIQNIVGDNGTILFPTYPKLVSYKYLLSDEIFDIINTPSYTGILNEFARRQKNAIRSLHPTKSVCAIGRYAKELTSTHQQSPYPYDKCSPYHKIMEYNGKIIGLGVSTSKLSFVHCVDDALKEEFPVEPYHKKLFHAKCLNYERKIEIVNTFAHNMRIMNHNIPKFTGKYIPEDICIDLKIHGMKFFRVKSKELFEMLIKLTKKNITIYPKKLYRERQIE